MLNVGYGHALINFNTITSNNILNYSNNTVSGPATYSYGIWLYGASANRAPYMIFSRNRGGSAGTSCYGVIGGTVSTNFITINQDCNNAGIIECVAMSMTNVEGANKPTILYHYDYQGTCTAAGANLGLNGYYFFTGN
jgi:hypothetical protein